LLYTSVIRKDIDMAPAANCPITSMLTTESAHGVRNSGRCLVISVAVR
jgi:hypothetical protein